MEFNNFVSKIQEQFDTMANDAKTLLWADIDKDYIWDLYLNSFPEGTNRLFRVRREYDCSCCRSFLRQYAGIVTVKDGKMHTIWEIDGLGEKFQPVADALDIYVHTCPIVGGFETDTAKLGTKLNRGMLTDGTICTYEHFFLEIPKRFVKWSRKGLKEDHDVFQRSLEEITMDAVDTVLELAQDKTLYRGAEHIATLNSFRKYKKVYESLEENARSNMIWEWVTGMSLATSHIRNTSIGTLLLELSDGMDVNTAVDRYERIVAPANYKRPKAIFTKKMLEQAKQTITDLGYLDSLGRRFAVQDDITVNNILWANRDTAPRLKPAGSIFDEMEKDIRIDPRKFDRAREIGIEEFVRDVLPVATSIEAFPELRHQKNFVSLTAAAEPGSPSMFKWPNSFGWAYSGNIADSDIRENVRKAGGKVDGIIRFSIQWNDEDFCPNDYDAHCLMFPKSYANYEIYYNCRRENKTDGNLDIDIIHPQQGVPAVENIVFPSKDRLVDGEYIFWVHCYTNRGGTSGFKAELEVDGEVYSFNHPEPLRQDESVRVASVTYTNENGVHRFNVKTDLESKALNTTIWNVPIYQFAPVQIMMYSPNYWDGQRGIGNRHYFFMLKDCINDEQPNGFYNEFLKSELEQHRRVFEALGAKTKVQDSTEQLSGLGFSETQRNYLIVRVTGSTERVMKIKF